MVYYIYIIIILLYYIYLYTRTCARVNVFEPVTNSKTSTIKYVMRVVTLHNIGSLTVGHTEEELARMYTDYKNAIHKLDSDRPDMAITPCKITIDMAISQLDENGKVNRYYGDIPTNMLEHEIFTRLNNLKRFARYAYDFLNASLPRDVYQIEMEACKRTPGGLRLRRIEMKDVLRTYSAYAKATWAAIKEITFKIHNNDSNRRKANEHCKQQAEVQTKRPPARKAVKAYYGNNNPGGSGIRQGRKGRSRKG